MATDIQNISWPGWKTVRLIGRGSYGGVYEIERDVFGQIEKAALKVLSIPQSEGDIAEMYNDGFDEESITSTFQNHLKNIVAEYSLMRKMNGCANIVSCDDVRYIQHDDGIGWDIYIKMELLTPLANALPQVVSEETAIKMAKDICTALELCKKHGIIHRDIKPQNIFVSEYGDYKLGDFGIAKTVERTMGGTKIGTYKYMAPEVYNNQPYGAAADIYSLGLVLYWLLNERRMPFLPLPPAKLGVGMDESARNRRLAGEQIPEPKHGSKELKAIVMKACAYKVEDRYSSAAEMLADIELLHGKTVVPVMPEPEVSQDEMTVASVMLPVDDDDEETVGIYVEPKPQAPSVEEETVLLPVAPKMEQAPAVKPEPVKKVEPAKKNAASNSGKAKEPGKTPKKKGLIATICAVVLLCAGIGFWLFHPHAYGEWQIQKEASCTAEGEQMRKCFCGEIETQVIAKLEHTVVLDPVVDATCVEHGLTEGCHCTVCGVILVEQQKTPMVEHNIVPLDAVPATCVETGLTSGMGCSVCDYIEVAQEVVEALGHTSVKDAAVAATCTAEGKTEGSHCSVCGEVLEKQQSIALKDHTAVKDKAVEATCSATGKTEGSHCSVCGKVLVAQKTTSKTEHKAVKDKAVAATCTSTGKTEGSHCSVCGTVIKAQQTTSKTSHTAVKDAAVSATCTEAGKTEGSHCSVCGTVIKAQTATGSALGHSYSKNECVRCGQKEWYAVITPGKSTYNVGETVHLTISVYSNNPESASVNCYLVAYGEFDDGSTETQRGNTVIAYDGDTASDDVFAVGNTGKVYFYVYTADGYYMGTCSITVK